MLNARAAIRRRSNYQLGFLGERHTAQVISSLAGSGYKIFHDLQLVAPGSSQRFNIDHALLGPAGIIAIETKARSKPAGAKGRAEVVCDGTALDFGTHRDVRSVQQALANARTLSEKVSERVGAKIPVIPMLCLPGWWVTARSLEPLFVANSEQIPRRVLSLPSVTFDVKTRNQIISMFAEFSKAETD